MELDALRDAWADNDRRLDATLRLNRRMLGAMLVNRARTRLQLLAAFAAAELAITLVAVGALGNFIYDNLGAPQFALPAAVLDVMAIAVLIARTRQIVTAAQVDQSQPITFIQKRIEALRMQRIRYTHWVLLLAPLAWTPMVIVALKGFLDVDAYTVPGTGWLAANLIVGLAIIPVAVWVSRRFGDRMGRSPIVHVLMRDIAGRNLNAAASYIATVSEFEEEPAG